MALWTTAICVAAMLLCEVSAFATPDTSLDTIPVSYFGGVTCDNRSQESIEMLAKMRLVIIEKWEGPCWHECYANLTSTPPIPCQPSCGGDKYQMNTIKRVKMANPKVAAVFYLNTLYDFPFLTLHGKFQDAKADIVDIKGKMVAFKNDNGMPNINVFDFSQQVGRDLWTGFVKNLSDSGYVDKLFDDKHQILSTFNNTGNFWQICERGTGKKDWNISSGVISQQEASSYNDGKQKVLDIVHDIFGSSGVIFFNNTYLGQINSYDPAVLVEEIKDVLKNYTYGYFHSKDLKNGNCTSTNSYCTTEDIVRFLLAVEKGAFLGCNGWDDQFDKPLGDPLGPAVKNKDTWERYFKSGTYVTWDTTTNTGKVVWSNSTIF